MPPPFPIQALRVPLKEPLALTCRFTRIALAGGLLCSFIFIASLAGADSPAKSEPSQLAAAPIVSIKNTSPSPLRPQTRYTVRTQIESIEPISWLERYGTVQIRELDR